MKKNTEKELNKEFDIPFYVFEAIVNYVELSAKGITTSEDWNEVVMLINMAKMNERLTESQATRLKRKYKRINK